MMICLDPTGIMHVEDLCILFSTDTVSTNSEIFPNIFETYIFVNIPTEIYISLKLMYLEKLPNI